MKYAVVTTQIAKLYWFEGGEYDRYASRGMKYIAFEQIGNHLAVLVPMGNNRNSVAHININNVSIHND